MLCHAQGTRAAPQRRLNLTLTLFPPLPPFRVLAPSRLCVFAWNHSGSVFPRPSPGHDGACPSKAGERLAGISACIPPSAGSPAPPSAGGACFVMPRGRAPRHNAGSCPGEFTSESTHPHTASLPASGPIPSSPDCLGHNSSGTGNTARFLFPYPRNPAAISAALADEASALRPLLSRT